MVVTVRLLGELEAQAGGRRSRRRRIRRAPALLAWLALHPGEHDRGPLAALLWPELAPSGARTALRSAVWALRRALGPHEREVLDGRTTIGLRCATDLAPSTPSSRRATGRALALCRGPLLAGLDEHAWVLAARAEHEARVAALRTPGGRARLSEGRGRRRAAHARRGRGSRAPGARLGPAPGTESGTL